MLVLVLVLPGDDQIRFMLAACRVTYSERVLTRAMFLDLVQSGVLMFDQVPLLEWTDGRVFVQSSATVRFLARTYGLYGRTDAEAARCDQIHDGVVDLLGKATPLPFSKDLEPFRAACAKYFPCFERLLAANAAANPENSQPLLVGSALSFPDVTLTEALAYHVELIGPIDSDSFPLLAAHHAAINASDWMQAFVASSHRHKFGDAVYVAHVNEVLGR